VTGESRGLLARAAAIRALRVAASAEGNPGAHFGQVAESSEGESGISEAERLEITASIEAIVRRPGLAEGGAPPLKARRRGFVLPLLVNLAALLVVALGLFLLSSLFSKSFAPTAASSQSLSSAEGGLLRAARAEAESKLREKDLAIAEVRKKAADLEAQRRSLAASFDQRLAERSKSLEASMAGRLDQETTRLKAAGVSEAEAKARLAELKTRLEGQGQADLAALKKSLDAERSAAEASLKRLQSDYEDSIAKLGADRRRIQDESKSREEALQASLDSKTRELESQGNAARSALEKSRAELAALSARSEAARSAEDRITGLYASVRDALRDRRFEAAAATTVTLRSYLDEPTVTALPELAARLPLDRFLAETLAALAASELQSASLGADRLLAQAQLLATTEAALKAAEAARRAGRPAEAEASYRQALESIPGLLEAHQWFLDKGKEAEAARRSLLDAALARAGTAWGAGDRDQALLSYRDALAYLPLDMPRRAEILDRAQALGSERGAASLGPRFAELEGALRDSGAKAAASAEKAAGLEAALRQKEAELGDLGARSESARLASEARIASLTAELEGLRKSSAEAAGRSATVVPGSPEALAAGDLAELKRRSAALDAAEARAAGFDAAYTRFKDRVAAGAGDTTAGLQALRRFFAEGPVSLAFPALAASFDATFSGYARGLASDWSGNAAWLAASAFAIGDPAERAAWLVEQRRIFAVDPFMSALVEALVRGDAAAARPPAPKQGGSGSRP